MKIKKIISRLDYINNLELAIPADLPTNLKISKASVAAGDGAAAAVVAGSTISFVSGIPKMNQADVLNSTLLAQLAANAAFDRVTNTIQWYQKYVEVLENIGWVVPAFSFIQQSFASNTVQMDKAALAILAAFVSGGELAVITATINALQNAQPGEKSITLFDSMASGGPAGNFQLGSASLDPTGNIQLSLGAFIFKATQTQSRFLFFTWQTKDLNMSAGSTSLLLNETIYATVRQAIITKLGDKATQFVADLNIG